MTMIAEILHKAADEYLAHNRYSYYAGNKVRYTCSAIELATRWDDDLCERIQTGLIEMGCPTSSCSAFVNLGYPDFLDEETQGARYMWLKFAALMAEEQGV